MPALVQQTQAHLKHFCFSVYQYANPLALPFAVCNNSRNSQSACSFVPCTDVCNTTLQREFKLMENPSNLELGAVQEPSSEAFSDQDMSQTCRLGRCATAGGSSCSLLLVASSTCTPCVHPVNVLVSLSNGHALFPASCMEYHRVHEMTQPRGPTCQAGQQCSSQHSPFRAPESNNHGSCSSLKHSTLKPCCGWPCQGAGSCARPAI
eukprot:scaffold160943_cov22-Tisochrysis_lutea.AAC.1